jgi:hypothetical protein
MVSSIANQENKAVCLSVLDGIGLFLTEPIWAITSSRIVERMGWSMAWGFFVVLFGMGGLLMMAAVQPVLQKHAQPFG